MLCCCKHHVVMNVSKLQFVSNDELLENVPLWQVSSSVDSLLFAVKEPDAGSVFLHTFDTQVSDDSWRVFSVKVSFHSSHERSLSQQAKDVGAMLSSEGGFASTVDKFLDMFHVWDRFAVFKFLGFHASALTHSNEQVSMFLVFGVNSFSGFSSRVFRNTMLVDEVREVYATGLFSSNVVPVSQLFSSEVFVVDSVCSVPARLLDDSVLHVWLHDVIASTQYFGEYYNFLTKCLTVDPVSLVAFLEGSSNNARLQVKIAKNLVVASNDLSVSQNEFRLTASHLVGSVSADMLAASVDAVLNVV